MKNLKIDRAWAKTIQNALIAAVLLVSVATGALADPQEEAFQVLEQWITAFNASDVDGIVKLYASDALFLGTGSKTVVTRTEDIRAYFERALKSDLPRGAVFSDYASRVLSDTAVLFTGLSASSRTKEGQTITAEGRATFVIAQGAEGWRIVHFHRSAMPN
jgi:uncharacterized protein (TIGR02246 family)